MKEFWKEVWGHASAFAPIVGIVLGLACVIGAFKLLQLIGTYGN